MRRDITVCPLVSRYFGCHRVGVNASWTVHSLQEKKRGVVQHGYRPTGQRINIILSDSTNLWLNANTTFQYPTEFAKGSRTVFLDGEAYLEVSKNEKKPFIVKTGKVTCASLAPSLTSRPTRSIIASPPAYSMGVLIYTREKRNCVTTTEREKRMERQPDCDFTHYRSGRILVA